MIPLRRFKYNGKNQIVRCPRGKTLRRSTRAHHGWFYKSRTSDCDQCPVRSECLSPRVRRRALVISDGYEALVVAIHEKSERITRELLAVKRLDPERVLQAKRAGTIDSVVEADRIRTYPSMSKSESTRVAGS